MNKALTIEREKTSLYQLLLCFYGYAALAFLIACILLMGSSGLFTGHYFHPHILAITHTMALGWGTMVILGASHQLVPVLTGAPLFSSKLGYASLVMAATGIPLLCCGFYHFRFDWLSITGGCLVNIAIGCFLVNVSASFNKDRQENVHTIFIFTATAWLLATTLVGLALLLNFRWPLLPKDSIHYLSWHAHMGIVGWFLLLVTGVASRLIPMFLLSKYEAARLLWIIYGGINAGLVLFVGLFFFEPSKGWYLLPTSMITAALLLFGYYCYQCWQQRIRKATEGPLNMSFLAVVFLSLPIIVLMAKLISQRDSMGDSQLSMAYGFTIFFGWLTAIILGMSFKTLPFMVWDQRYGPVAGSAIVPQPRDLFHHSIFRAMCLAYLAGFILFVAGILSASASLLLAGTIGLLLSAILYSWNIFKMIVHRTQKISHAGHK